MPDQFNFTIGGMTIRLIPDSKDAQFSIKKPVATFQTNNEPGVILQVLCGQMPAISDTELVFDSRVTWQMLKRGQDWLVRVGMEELFQVGVFSPDFHHGKVYVARNEGDPDRFNFPLDYPMGEVIMMHLLPGYNGVMMHAAGVIYNGEGYLFTGHGGVGKSTTARLWQATPGALVVNDDKVILRCIDGEWRMFGTPWHGEGGMAEPLSAPLKRIFILKQAKENRLDPIPMVQAAAMLLARAFVPLWDAGRMDSAIQFMGDLLQVIPCEQYGFLPDTSAVEFIQSL